MKQIVEYEQHSNDLFAKFKCECPDPYYKDNPVLANSFRKSIKLNGYNDNYFFNVVNKEPRELTCDCGRKYRYQWTYAGVVIEKI